MAAEERTPTRCGETTLRWGTKTYVMGIVNATPDSFSGDGLGADLPALVARGEQCVREGADLLDIGGESTRPGATFVSEAEEMARVVPVIAALAARVAVPLSVDTSRAAVAEAALAAGATMVNDVWGLHRDRALAAVVARAGAALVLMHNRLAAPAALDAPGGRNDALGGYYDAVAYPGDLMAAIADWLREGIAWAEAAGVARAQLLVDPGIGFGKTPAQNLEVMRRFGELRTLGLPVLLATSRKSFIGRTLDLPITERLEGTAATVALGIAAGADMIRVHDVRAMSRVARMSDAIVRGGPGESGMGHEATGLRG